jgi:hypothetical protein
MYLDRDPRTGTRTGMRTGWRTGSRTVPEAKHQPPSRRRYAAAHPTIGVHCDRKTYDALIALRERSGLSFGQLFRQALGVVTKDVEAARGRGYREAKARYCLTTPCSGCGKPMEILAGSKMAERAVRGVRRWRHHKCIESGASPD